jgi:hypothetical protein
MPVFLFVKEGRPAKWFILEEEQYYHHVVQLEFETAQPTPH